MSANKMSDEELDGLFRKSVENVEPPFDPEAWQAMEQKLDQAQVRAPWYKRLLPLLLLSLIPLLLLLTLRKNEQLTPLYKDKPAVVATEPEPATAELPQPLPAAKADKEESAGAVAQAAAAKSAPAVAPPQASRLKAARTRGAYKAGAVVLPSERDETRQEHAAPPVAGEDLLDIKAVAPGLHAERAPWQQKREQQLLSPLHTLPTAAVQDSAETPAIAPAVAADSSGQKKASPFAKSIRLALVAAPDITTVKFKNPDAVSANAGIVVGVPLTNRLSLVTGAVWANKVYGATPEDYNPGDDYWQGKKIPNAIDARCKVLDIPLNLEYQLLQRPKFTLALQAGLSSYLMLNEAYTYIYGSGYGAYEKVWEVKNENRHWFKVQNLSVSYTHHLTPSLFVGAEPFVKIPLADIGAGHVKLTSAGVFLTAGYTLPLRK